jgi:hypothetical protein
LDLPAFYTTTSVCWRSTTAATTVGCGGDRLGGELPCVWRRRRRRRPSSCIYPHETVRGLSSGGGLGWVCGLVLGYCWAASAAGKVQVRFSLLFYFFHFLFSITFVEFKFEFNYALQMFINLAFMRSITRSIVLLHCFVE